ncbi:hypothetical protein EES43_24535 [Streptomyces sp. ADI96-02]|uniref:hypothetical protein n=1 Tax=Streptomyces sp. ADI96-02 TaxID=1522760 RepID=UPI000F555603|nr:hypothetical protein [Streptomyces sp. ADI96-02]RPK56213.1 hypothetical protein EES43_24535 [Streptomyces sp. ADI96-02]
MAKTQNYFWFMTIQTPNGAGFLISSYQGQMPLVSGTTRLGFFNEIREEIARRNPLAQGGCVIAFDIQPNNL